MPRKDSPSATAITPADAARELLRRRAARRALADFAAYVSPEWEWSWHHRALAAALDRFTSGACPRLVVNMPPQHAKSQLCSRWLPAYLLGRDPDTRLICCSHTHDLAGAMNRDVQRVMSSSAYRVLFPETQLAGANNRTLSGAPLRNSEIFEIVGRRGYYKAAGVGAAIVGRGFDAGIIDDPYAGREDADSPATREKVWGWYTGEFLTRGNKGARILVIMTRWHEDDLVGRLLRLQASDRRSDRWEVLCLPAVKEGPPTAEDPRQVGEALWPARYPLDDLERRRAASDYDWHSQYQQRPRAPGSAEWPDDYFGPAIWYDDLPPGEDAPVLTVMALDPSKGRDARHGDYSAWVASSLDRRGTVWVDADLARRPVERIVADGLTLVMRHRPAAVVVEANQFQSLLASDFARQARARGIRTPVYGVENHLPKPVRIRQLGGYLARKELRFKSESNGCRLLVQQLREFPSGAHDDGPDALEMALRLLRHLTRGKAETRRSDDPQLIGTQ